MTLFSQSLAERLRGAVETQQYIENILGCLGCARADRVDPDPQTLGALRDGRFEVITGREAIAEARGQNKRISGARLTVETSFTALVQKLGNPDDGPSDNKSAATWFVKVEGEWFCVYDNRLRFDVNNNGTGLSVAEIRSDLNLPWSIGATEKGAKLSAFIDYLNAS
ncbi:MAG: hypothetical protein K1X79_07820 [Oligoflexia bacterium]|nr:hypothetical protein [Oligoflexia bacterium]